MTLSSNKKTILLVDDEEMILDIGETAMNRWGYDIIPAASGETAVTIYQKEKDRIDLVVLDVILSDISGDEVLSCIQKINPAVKVLVASGYGVDERVKKMTGGGRSPFLQKPFNINKLRHMLGKMLAEG